MGRSLIYKKLQLLNGAFRRLFGFGSRVVEKAFACKAQRSRRNHSNGGRTLPKKIALRTRLSSERTVGPASPPGAAVRVTTEMPLDDCTLFSAQTMLSAQVLSMNLAKRLVMRGM